MLTTAIPANGLQLQRRLRHTQHDRLSHQQPSILFLMQVS